MIIIIIFIFGTISFFTMSFLTIFLLTYHYQEYIS